METIRNYLETMFMQLPDTPEVRRAKKELGQMMEDKYNELTADGMSTNEAVGIVISEFGNLDELAESLGIQRFMGQQVEQGKIFEESVEMNLEDARFILEKNMDEILRRAKIGRGDYEEKEVS